MSKHLSLEPVRYKDLYVRLIAAVLAAFIVTVFGETQSLFELLLLRDFYVGFFASLLIALVLISYIYWVTVRLDKSYPWEQRPLGRTLLQVLLGMMVPALLDFLQAWLYLRSLHVNILKTTYVSHDFQYILLMLAIINIYYFAFYFFRRWQQADQMHRFLREQAASGIGLTSDAPNVFMVSRGARNIPLAFDQIAYVFREDEANYLVTISGERFFVSQTLDDIIQRLDSRFYRLNRQVIAGRAAVTSFNNLEHGKFQVQLDPPFAEIVVVSSKRAKSFREWIRKH